MNWESIACALLWKLAPGGVVLTRQDLGALPFDRVLIDDRHNGRIRLTFVTVSEAMRIRGGLAEAKTPAGVSSLEGRWEKIAVVMLWKLQKHGVTITSWDLKAVPHDKTILASGHADGVEFRFMPRSEASRLTAWDREHEGRLIHEGINGT
jgi:hypothetical protein